MKKIIILILFLTISLFSADAELDIVKKSISLPKISIGISPNSMNIDSVKKVRDIIRKDLQVSGHFDVINLEEIVPFDKKPNMLDLSNKGVDLFLNIDLKASAFGSLSIDTKLFDINSKKLLFQKSFSTKKDSRYPFLAHRISISVNKQLSAPSIDWMDKFVIFSQYMGARKADIMIADYTLTFQKKIIKGGLNIFPKWANEKKDSFYYTTYDNGLPTIIKSNLYTRKKESILKSEGMAIVSDVSSDGKKLLITASPQYQPDIYLYDTESKSKVKLTNYKGIDVGGHFIENDSKIVFVSDRLNYPNIFSKKIGSRGVQRMVFHGKNNSSVTSYKNFVVYTSRDRTNEFGTQTFNLYLISTKSDFLKRLTSNGNNQFPKFSKDGESIIFIKNINNRSSLGIIRLNHSKSFLFPLKSGKIQSIDW